MSAVARVSDPAGAARGRLRGKAGLTRVCIHRAGRMPEWADDRVDEDYYRFGVCYYYRPRPRRAASALDEAFPDRAGAATCCSPKDDRRLRRLARIREELGTGGHRRESRQAEAVPSADVEEAELPEAEAEEEDEEAHEERRRRVRERWLLRERSRQEEEDLLPKEAEEELGDGSDDSETERGIGSGDEGTSPTAAVAKPEFLPKPGQGGRAVERDRAEERRQMEERKAESRRMVLEVVLEERRHSEKTRNEEAAEAVVDTAAADEDDKAEHEAWKNRETLRRKRGRDDMHGAWRLG